VLVKKVFTIDLKENLLSKERKKCGHRPSHKGSVRLKEEEKEGLLGRGREASSPKETAMVVVGRAWLSDC